MNTEDELNKTKKIDTNMKEYITRLLKAQIDATYLSFPLVIINYIID